MIKIKSPAELKSMARAGRLVGQIMAQVSREVAPGVKTKDLDRMAEDLCLKAGARPAFKGYRGYPFSLCCSTNEQVVHGFPDKSPLREGDILSMDFGAVLEGFFGDMAITVPVGEIDPETRRLLQVTEASLQAGIAQMRPGNRLGDVSHAVQEVVEEGGFSVVRQFVGHGIGRDLHEDPQLPNYGKAAKGPVLREGMVIAIEPMVNMGGFEVTVLADGWTAVTVDGSLSAHFEHTVAVAADGPQVLTAMNGGQAG